VSDHIRKRLTGTQSFAVLCERLGLLPAVFL